MNNQCSDAMNELQKKTRLAQSMEDLLLEYFDHLDGEAPSNIHCMVMAQIEKPLFDIVLRKAEGNQTKAAEWLGVSRSTLARKLQMYDLK